MTILKLYVVMRWQEKGKWLIFTGWLTSECGEKINTVQKWGELIELSDVHKEGFIWSWNLYKKRSYEKEGCASCIFLLDHSGLSVMQILLLLLDPENILVTGSE